MSFETIIGIGASVFTATSLIPQLVKVAKEKKAENWSYLIPKATIDQVLKDRSGLFVEKKASPSPAPVAAGVPGKAPPPPAPAPGKTASPSPSSRNRPK